MPETPIQKLDPDEQPAANQQESIFANETVSLEGYDKSLKNARIWLYVVAGIQILTGVYEYFSMDMYDDSTRLLLFGIDAGVGLIFLALAFWSFKKPLPAFLTALIFFPAFHILLMVLDSSNIYRGIILKILVVIALAKAYNDARTNEEYKKSFGNVD